MILSGFNLFKLWFTVSVIKQKLLLLVLIKVNLGYIRMIFVLPNCVKFRFSRVTISVKSKWMHNQPEKSNLNLRADSIVYKPFLNPHHIPSASVCLPSFIERRSDVCSLPPFSFETLLAGFLLTTSPRTLVGVLSDLRVQTLWSHFSVLILLGLSAAFDTSDYFLLFKKRW